MVALIKTTALSGYCELVNELGGDPAQLLRRCHLDPDVIASREGVISHKAEICAIERAATELRCDDFGLKLAESQDIYILGPAAAVALNSTCVADALRKINESMHWFSPAIDLRIEREVEDGKSLIVFDQDPSLPRCRNPHEQALAVLATILRTLAGQELRILAVYLSFPSPLPQSRYQDVFDAPVLCDEPRSALLIRTRDLSKSLQHQNDELHRLLDIFTAEVTSDYSLDLGRQVRQMIENLLPTHSCSLNTIASQLGFTPRTLQRQLAAQGESFEQMMDTVRRSLADDYLTEHEMPLVQVAALLGYSEQSTFSRACKRWYGCTPLQRRQALLH
ncbi:HTH-type transcriptional regulator VirS [Microbulbifer aggregans]|uniref:HTH-type transcriptional regulator VirS n=1 Tax=Microbulbifer aggregans TaxID=1769779 RepID=A0A1C9WAI6_9GAMM|nr:AraC family transcriptional regulator [Microbulbifer aggregans]AOS98145.1 HTH-type transcriptional regulator VirS [Microbulbifer aggregans]